MVSLKHIGKFLVSLINFVICVKIMFFNASHLVPFEPVYCVNALISQSEKYLYKLLQMMCFLFAASPGHQ